MITKFLKNMILVLAALMPLTSSAFVDDGQAGDQTAWARMKGNAVLTWGSKDKLYRRHEAPALQNGKAVNNLTMQAWRGERIGALGVLYVREAIGEPIKVVCKTAAPKLDKPGHALNATVEASFLRYVWTDDFRGCGKHPTDLTPWGVPDCIDLPEAELQTEGQECRPLWVSVEVPCQAKAGSQKVDVQIVGARSGKKYGSLTLNVEILGKVRFGIKGTQKLEAQLPAPKDYTFHLDFWQQPYSVSRYYKVEPWSDEHLTLLRPYMKRLARAGQKVAGAILFYEPWGEQSNDKFEPMVETRLTKKGEWDFSYDVFDRWVAFMAECGISRQIDCYSMVPWDMTFRYYDEKTASYKNLKAKTSDAAYKKLWTAFLKSFAEHLKTLGIFDKTCIAMDERGLQDMLNAYKIAQEAVPGMKMTLAGNRHPELIKILQDYSLPFGSVGTEQGFTMDDFEARFYAKQTSTLYTCCTEAHPNILSNSTPQEAAFIPAYCVLTGHDGYLHWAWLNWTDDPLHDTRFRSFSPGDTYIIYPDNRSSVRWERFLEGVQLAEKYNAVMRQNFDEEETLTGYAKETTLEQAVAQLRQADTSDPATVAKAVNDLQAVLNRK